MKSTITGKNILWVVEEYDDDRWQVIEGCDVCFSRKGAQERRKELIGIYTSPHKLRIARYFSDEYGYYK